MTPGAIPVRDEAPCRKLSRPPRKLVQATAWIDPPHYLPANRLQYLPPDLNQPNVANASMMDITTIGLEGTAGPPIILHAPNMSPRAATGTTMTRMQIFSDLDS